MSMLCLGVTLTLPKINGDGWIDPDDAGDGHELTLDLAAGDEVFAAMTGGYVPKWSRLPDWDEMTAIAHQAADYFASKLGPTMTAANGALLDFMRASVAVMQDHDLPGVCKVTYWALASTGPIRPTAASTRSTTDGPQTSRCATFATARPDIAHAQPRRRYGPSGTIEARGR